MNLSPMMKSKEDDNFCAGLMQLSPQPRASSSLYATTTHHCTVTDSILNPFAVAVLVIKALLIV